MAHILLLEPDSKLARIYASALSRPGYQISACTTAQDAILKADKHRPDAVVLELQLVGHSGIEFLYEFRSYVDWLKLPVIIVSHVPPAEFALSKKLLYDHLGVNKYYYKPNMDLSNLLRAVDAALAGGELVLHPDPSVTQAHTESEKHHESTRHDRNRTSPHRLR